MVVPTQSINKFGSRSLFYSIKDGNISLRWCVPKGKREKRYLAPNECTANECTATNTKPTLRYKIYPQDKSPRSVAQHHFLGC